MTKRVRAIAFTLFLLALPVASMSQDTTLLASQNPASHKDISSPHTTEHSPRRALILSAVLPGAGQVYNKQAWKVPIIYAAIGGIGYYTYSNYTQMKYYRDEYLYRVQNGNQTQYPDNPDMVATPTSNIYNMYEAYNKTFQLSVIISVAVYGINLLDAYVFGHLFEFQISDDLSLNMSPSLMPTGGLKGFSTVNFVPAASFSLRF